ncbi:MAG TPA: hypothetical protein VHM19_19310 [Polyangiales bacterium]|jgi:hypothetical protein|nr:hypothetical protein [Polyangiales bacterium]
MKLYGVALFLIGCAWLCTAHRALAQEGDESALDDGDSYGYGEEPPPPPKNLTLSLSPLHVLVPMAEAQAEVRAGSYLGFAVIGGGGRVSAETSKGATLHFPAYELGGQAVFYPSRAFENFQLGAEAIYLHVGIEDVIGTKRVTGLSAGLTLGGFLGYKWIDPSGFTVFMQGGASTMVLPAHLKNELGQSATLKENSLYLLLNLNVGWSF